MPLTVEELAQTIDHTVLKAETTRKKVKQLCEEAMDYNFAAVCINAVHVEYAVELLKDSEVKVCCVVGFPLGATLPQVKAAETREVVALGAHEIDMVINVGALRDENYDLVKKDIPRGSRRHVLRLDDTSRSDRSHRPGHILDLAIAVRVLARRAGGDPATEGGELEGLRKVAQRKTLHIEL